MATITAIKDRIGRLDQASFQILCDDYLSRVGYPNLVALGTMSGSQKTTPGTPDTYFCKKDDKYVFAEYTTQRNNLVSKIRSDLQKCFDETCTNIPVGQIVEIVYCHTSANIKPGDDRALKGFCAEHGTLLTLIGIDKLADDIYWNYQILAKEHLSLTVDTGQIQTTDEFISQYDSNVFASPLETVFMFRGKELDELAEAFSKRDVVIITGSAGQGKTRLAIEFAQKYADENETQLYCIHSRPLGLFDDLCMYFGQPGKYFVVVDDANQLAELKLVVDLVNTMQGLSSIKLLMTVRDYAIDKVKRELVGTVAFEEIKLDKFTDDQIKSLVKENYGIINDLYLDRIATIAEGNARMAMLAGKVAVKANRLDSINDATELYDEYYSPLLHESGLENDTVLISTAGIAAFLGAFHLEHIDPIIPVLDTVSITKDDFLGALSRLSDIEIIDIYYDKAVKFSDQCFANYLIKYTFYDKRLLSLSEMIKVCFFSYRERTLFAVNTLISVFHSNSVHDFVGAEMKIVWNQLKEDDPERFAAYLKSFYPVNPVEALFLLQETIEQTDPVVLCAEDIDTERGKNYQSVTDDIITVLCGYSDTSDLDAALDLFFQYYLKRPDKYMQFYHASTTAFCINKDSEKYGYYTQIRFFTKMYEYSENWSNDYILILFLDIAKVFLQLEFSPHTSSRDGKSITVYRIPLQQSEHVSTYRSLIWSELEHIAGLGKHSNRIRAILQEYGRGIEECSIGIVREEAPLICRVIKAGLSPNILADCLAAEHISSCFNRYDIPIDLLEPYLHNPLMDAYKVLVGPDFDQEYDFEKREVKHKSQIKEYLCSMKTRSDGFSRLIDVFCSSQEVDYRATTGINMALQDLADDKTEFLHAVRIVLNNDYCVGIAPYKSLQVLFAYLSPTAVQRFIRDNAKDDSTRNLWLYAYYHELPENRVDREQLDGLYAFLKDNSDIEITKSAYRDIVFLNKFRQIDTSVFVKASQIILAKKSYSTYMVDIYFGLLFNPHSKQDNLIDLFCGNISVLEDIYFFLLHYGSNLDHDGAVLLTLFRTDKTMPNRLAIELLQEKKAHSLRDVDSRYHVLFDLDNYIDVIDTIVNESIRATDYPIHLAAGVIKQFFVLPQNRLGLRNKQENWILHYIVENAFDEIRMECIFDVISESSPDLRRKCIESLIEQNSDYEAFRKITLLPRSFSAPGSLVPVYSGWIHFLESLLPLFSGIVFIEHKNRILQQIDSLRAMIEKEQISDIITG